MHGFGNCWQIHRCNRFALNGNELMFAKLLHIARGLQQPRTASTAHQCRAVRLVPLLADIHEEAETGIIRTDVSMHAHANCVADRIRIDRIGPPEGEGERVVLEHL
jgi:hypothetical protein